MFTLTGVCLVSDNAICTSLVSALTEMLGCGRANSWDNVV
jgi:hypothetical protein